MPSRAPAARWLLAVAIAAAALSPALGWAQSNFGSRTAAEHYVRLEWQPGQTRRGLPIVWGYVHNVYGEALGNVRLSVQELDGAGHPVNTTIAYVDGVIQPKGYVYFEARVPRAAVRYRVILLHYDLFIDPGGNP